MWRKCFLFACSLVLWAGGCSAAESYGPYTAEVVRVIDGDTIELRVHLWPGLEKDIKLRLDGVNTPETHRAPECEKRLGRQAAEFARRFIGESKMVKVSGVRLGKYAGRALGKIEVPGKGDLGAALLAAGLAKEYHGGRRGRWCW